MDHVLSTHLFVNHRLTTVWLERIWNSGIPAVEIFCARQHLDYHDQAQISGLGHWFRDSELKLHSLHSPMYTDEIWGRSGPHAVVSITEPSKGKRIQMIDEIKRALDVAETIPFRYLIQHLGTTGEEFDDRKIDAAFSSLEEISLFAHQRGVQVLLENTPNAMASAEKLMHFLRQTHLRLDFCLDVGHAHMNEGIPAAFETMKEKIRSTHLHDNDGKSDQHLFPFFGEGGTIDWTSTMRLLRSCPGQYPLLLELREVPTLANPFETVKQIFEKLESLDVTPTDHD
jgi:sugar phosphate isomerase/epimerase